MTFWEGIYKARSSIVFVAALIAALALVVWLEKIDIENEMRGRIREEVEPQIRADLRVKLEPMVRAELEEEVEDDIRFELEVKIEKEIRDVLRLEPSSDIPEVTPRDLTDEDKARARIAWKYFENNNNPATGMVNSVDGYTASTMWDAASYMMGMISALRSGYHFRR